MEDGLRAAAAGKGKKTSDKREADAAGMDVTGACVLGDVFIVQGEYEDWEDYRKACSTLEGDQEFVWLWEKLLSNAKLIEHFLTDNSYGVHISK
nr:unnamed protein product [Digitaria exilis]CAB3504036.1 unnamed protein product [Digitaria exilis]